MTNADELAVILNKWSLGELSSSIEQINFKLNQMKKFTFSGTIILEDMRFELDFIAFLCNQLHLPVIPMIDPPGIFLLNNGHYCALFPFIDGIKYINTYEENFRKNLPKGFIHVDLHDGNVLFFHNQNKLAAVLDFDDMSFGPFLIDIGIAICFWCLCRPQMNTDYARQFLIEHQRTGNMSLTNDEWDLLELYCYMTMFHQILFTIQSRDSEREIEEMMNELLLPIEQISQDKMFLTKIR